MDFTLTYGFFLCLDFMLIEIMHINLPGLCKLNNFQAEFTRLYYLGNEVVIGIHSTVYLITDLFSDPEKMLSYPIIKCNTKHGHAFFPLIPFFWHWPVWPTKNFPFIPLCQPSTYEAAENLVVLSVNKSQYFQISIIPKMFSQILFYLM